MKKIENQILNAFENALWRKVKRISRLPNKLTVGHEENWRSDLKRIWNRTVEKSQRDQQAAQQTNSGAECDVSVSRPLVWTLFHILGDRNQSQKVDKAVWEKYYLIFFWIRYWENKIVLEIFWIQTQIHLFLDSVFKNWKSMKGSQNRSKKIGSHKKSQNWSRSDFRSHQTLQWRTRKIRSLSFSVFRWADWPTSRDANLMCCWLVEMLTTAFYFGLIFFTPGQYQKYLWECKSFKSLFISNTSNDDQSAHFQEKACIWSLLKDS